MYLALEAHVVEDTQGASFTTVVAVFDKECAAIWNICCLEMCLRHVFSPPTLFHRTCAAAASPLAVTFAGFEHFETNSFEQLCEYYFARMLARAAEIVVCYSQRVVTPCTSSLVA